VELRFSCNTHARWHKEEQNHSWNQECKLPMSSCRGCDAAFLPSAYSCWRCDVAFLPVAIIVAILRSRSRARSSRPRSSRSRSLKSRSRPWGRWGRAWGLGHQDRGHRLEDEVSEVEAVRSVRSRSRARCRSPRLRSPLWGWGRRSRGRWGQGHHLDAKVNEVGKVEAASSRARSWARSVRVRPPRSAAI
jgi:hypothetical protein